MQNITVIDNLLVTNNLMPAFTMHRLFARIIDCFVLAAIYGIVYAMFPKDSLYDANAAGLYAMFITFCIQAFLYYPFTEANGGTIGKRLMRLQLMSTSLDNLGSSPSLNQSFKKSLFVYWPLFLLISLAVMISVNADSMDKAEYYSELFEGVQAIFSLYAILCELSLFSDQYRRTWHDKYADIIVVHKQSNASIHLSSESPKAPRVKLALPQINSSVFTSKLAYMFYVVLSIIIILFVKYKLDIMKEERHFELKKEYYDQTSE